MQCNVFLRNTYLGLDWYGKNDFCVMSNKGDRGHYFPQENYLKVDFTCKWLAFFMIDTGDYE